MAQRMYLGVDLQEGFLNDEIRSSGYIARVERFLAGLPPDEVVLSKFINRPDGPFPKYLNWPKMQAGDPDTRLIGSLEQMNFRCFEKSGYTLWLAHAKARADELGAAEIVIFGLDSDACVLKTALDVFEAGYRPVVLQDLCDCSGGPERNEQGLRLLKTLIGVAQVIDASEL